MAPARPDAHPQEVSSKAKVEARDKLKELDVEPRP